MTSKQPCNGSDCGCSNVSRRDFVRAVGVGAAAVALSGTGAMAGPFDPEAFEHLVPADKKLKPEWVKSLFDRGEPAWYTGKQLEFIGMPVGGICAGQVYLGGDGRLWHWDIFNQHIGTGAGHYAQPMHPDQPFTLGFAVRAKVGDKPVVRTLDQAGFPNVKFRGEYPIGLVEYREADFPIAVSLEAFSPFIPLRPQDSAYPATVLRYTLKNTGKEAVDVEIAGWMENAVCVLSGKSTVGLRVNRLAREPGLITLECSAAQPKVLSDHPGRAEIVFEDFEKESYEGWKIEGTAFGDGPIERSKMPAYQGDVGGEGKRVVNSHNARHGEDVVGGDAHTGKLTSKSFSIERNFITFYIGGGNNPGETCLNLVIDGKVARTATGRNDNKMRLDHFDVRDLQGKTGFIEIVDSKKGGWGNIGVDQIVFTDKPAAGERLEKLHDFGTMALAILNATGNETGDVSMNPANADTAFQHANDAAEINMPFSEKLTGALRRSISLKPDESQTITFVIAWNFPNLKLPASAKDSGRLYATRFDSAVAVVRDLAKNIQSLYDQTRLWRDTWYDSSLPYWFLDRTFANTSILATSTCFQFADGRFYSWEGVGCCEGTCTHVWHYAHAMGRIFPQLERDLRERTDYGLAFDPKSGIIHFRGEVENYAIDGQAGCILRTYREHQMSADDAFLRRVWPAAKRAVQFLIDQPGGKEGILVGAQNNTLDTAWFGPVAWLSGMYLAALRAAEEMANEMGDTDFAKQCRSIFEIGSKRIVAELFDGEYFYNKPDPKRLDTINSGSGCEIDQLLGQSWAFQLGLGRIFAENESRTALKNLWRYNFAPNVARYREANKPGRWYAMPGEAGLLMCTFPRQDWDYRKAAGKGPDWAAGYFNECMNGFEYQAAGHMIADGLVQEGLAVTRAVHDRYSVDHRNPWNEVECGDHYARSMASYGVFLTACGFAYHGPKGHIALAPKVSADNFKAAFTAAEAWGSLSQRRDATSQEIAIDVKFGTLKLRSIGCELLDGSKADKVKVSINGKPVEAAAKVSGTSLRIELAGDLILSEKGTLHITIA